MLLKPKLLYVVVSGVYFLICKDELSTLGVIAVDSMYMFSVIGLLLLRIKRGFAIVFFSFTTLALVSAMVGSWGSQSAYFWHIFDVLSAASALLVMLSVPILIIPYFRIKKLHTGSIITLADFTIPLADCHERIKRVLTDLQTMPLNRSIAVETNSRLEENITSRTKEYEDLCSMIERSKKELQECQVLMNLSKEQRDALFAILKKQKYVDYLVGFFLGALSSFLVTYFPKLIALLGLK